MIRFLLVILFLMAWFSALVGAQETNTIVVAKQQANVPEADLEVGIDESDDEVSDPATPTAEISHTMNRIRQVKEFDKLATEVMQLKATNEQLRQELVKQSTSLPEIKVHSKAISATQAIAILSVGEKQFRVWKNSTITVSIRKGMITPLRVIQITPQGIEVEFPEFKKILMLSE